MADNKPKGANVTVALIIDGVQQVGSFAKCESFEESPDADIVKSSYLGQAEDDADFQHHGWDLKFTIAETDDSAARAYDKIVAAAAAGRALPSISLMVITTYPDPSKLPATDIYTGIVLKKDSRNVSGKKEMIKNTFSAFAKRKVTA